MNKISFGKSTGSGKGVEGQKWDFRGCNDPAGETWRFSQRWLLSIEKGKKRKVPLGKGLRSEVKDAARDWTPSFSFKCKWQMFLFFFGLFNGSILKNYMYFSYLETWNFRSGWVRNGRRLGPGTSEALTSSIFSKIQSEPTNSNSVIFYSSLFRTQNHLPGIRPSVALQLFAIISLF